MQKDQYWPLSETANSTSIRRPDFQLVVPLKWTAVPTDDGFHFRNEVLPEELFVRVLPAKSSFDATTRSDVLNRLLAIQRNAASAQANGEAEFLAEQNLSQPGHSEAQVLGVWKRGKVQIALRVWVYPSKAITASLFRYSLEPIAARFDGYSRIILDRLEVL